MENTEQVPGLRWLETHLATTMLSVTWEKDNESYHQSPPWNGLESPKQGRGNVPEGVLNYYEGTEHLGPNQECWFEWT